MIEAIQCRRCVPLAEKDYRTHTFRHEGSATDLATAVREEGDCFCTGSRRHLSPSLELLDPLVRLQTRPCWRSTLNNLA